MHAAMEDADALRLHAALMSGPPCVRAALGVLRDALRLYGDHRVVVSFNGGKDATVVAHLLRAALAAHRREGRVDQQAAQGAGASAAARQQQRPLAVYWEEPLMFPELDAFVKGTAARYGLELIVYTGGFVEGLADLVAKRPGCALVMGTRSTDPNGACARAGCWLTQLCCCCLSCACSAARLWWPLHQTDTPALSRRAVCSRCRRHRCRRHSPLRIATPLSRHQRHRL